MPRPRRRTPTVTPAPGRPPLDEAPWRAATSWSREGSRATAATGRDGGTTDTTVVGSIPDIERLIPDPWTLLDSVWATPQLSDTGFLALDLTSGPKGDENAAVGVFDLLAPDADPLVIPFSSGGGSRMAGDRLWVAMADNEFTVYDLPSATPTLLSRGGHQCPEPLLPLRRG